MKIILRIISGAALGYLTLGTIGAAEVEGITDPNLDGEEYSYQVTCTDRKKGSVVLVNKPRQYCAYPGFGQAQCRDVWTVESAAAYVCSQQ